MKYLRLVLNKYTITAAAFAILMLFNDQNDYRAMQARDKELEDVNNSIAFLNKEIEQMDASYVALMHNPKELERFARERYRMKKDNEDLYIIEQK